MTSHNRTMSAYLDTCRDELDARDLLGDGWIDTRHQSDSVDIAPLRQYRLTPVARWSAWMFAALCNGSLAAVFVGGWVAGIMTTVLMMGMP